MSQQTFENILTNNMVLRNGKIIEPPLVVLARKCVFAQIRACDDDEGFCLLNFDPEVLSLDRVFKAADWLEIRGWIFPTTRMFYYKVDQ